MQKAGYHFFRDPRTNNESYVMRITRNFYPRYHVYIENNVLDLHIDMKKASYEGSRAHSGEYDGPKVEEEIERLKKWAVYLAKS